METSLSKILAVLVASQLLGGSFAKATSISTFVGTTADALASGLDAFARDHNGASITIWSELAGYVDIPRIERGLKAPLDQTMLIVSKWDARLNTLAESKIFAVTSFPIHEDRRNSIGRYIIYRRTDGRFKSGWESEDIIQAALADRGGSISASPVFEERPLKQLYPEYTARLVEDAVKHGIPIEQAMKVVEKHIEDVSSRQAKPATTWAEIAAAASAGPTSTSSVPATPTPVQSPTQAASPRVASPIAQAPAAPVEERAPVWPWVVGILALVVIVAFALKRRT